MAAVVHKSNVMDQISSDLNPDWLNSEVKTGVRNPLFIRLLLLVVTIKGAVLV